MTTGPRVRAAGPAALLVEFDTLREARDYYAEAVRRRAAGELPADTELVPAARTLLLDGVPDRALFAARIRSWRPEQAPVVGSRDREIPTVYDGPDLAAVAELSGIGVAEVVALHSGALHEVAFVGFAPGFAYLAGNPAALWVPRRRWPRTRVPAGSVGLADQFTGVYPRESPGGWQLIGRTDRPMWDPAAQPAAYLLPGDRVRFVPVAA